MKTRRLISAILVFFVVCLVSLPAMALVKIDKQSVNLALKYGMQNAGLGYSTLLGNNWMESGDGTLLNIYTPFMMIASKSYSGGFPSKPSEQDLKDARGRYGRLITQLTDPKNPLHVKFSVSLFGDDPAFAMGYQGWIEGFGRGKEFTLKPVRQLRQRSAYKDEGANVKPYEAVNAYYFNFGDLELLDDYQFILEDANGERTVFKIRNDRIY